MGLPLVDGESRNHARPGAYESFCIIMWSAGAAKVDFDGGESERAGSGRHGLRASASLSRPEKRSVVEEPPRRFDTEAQDCR